MTTRFGFLASGAAALAVIAAPATIGAAADAAVPIGLALDRLGTWLRVGADGFVDVFTGKVEIGMGTITGLAQIVAEELDVALERVRMITGDTDLTPDQGGVGGSTSTQSGANPLRHAAAEARRVLLAAASVRLGVPPERLTVENGIVRSGDDARRAVPYGALIDALAHDPALIVSGEGFGLDVRGAGTPKDPAGYRLVGTPAARLDVAPKAYGTFRYVVDVRVPGMLHARVVRPPAVGARPLTVDDGPLRDCGDARLLRVGDLLAVAATREWDAVRGARALVVRWSAPTTSFPAQGSLAAAMWAAPAFARDQPIARGDVARADAQGASVVEASYSWPFQAHATMGPGCAVADVRRDGRATIWCGAQKPHALKEGIADLLGIAPGRVRVIFVEDAGSYGRAGFDDAAADAALLSRAAGKPVRVQWMRHDMTQWGPKAPAIVARARGLVRDGAIAALDLTVRAFNGGEISSHPDSAGNFLGGQLAGHANTKPRVEYAVYGKNSPAYAIPALRAQAELVAPLAP
ncbi:MAG TPA: molybdopterin cofactor-binding domain-containing protein, partial [Candidatus Acidoferrum sp.]|nr:molybdopterin cofactor-binding domain-containing protein [Candidatus Acidoferrum sp.]